MKREEILNRIGISVPASAKVKVFVDTDAKNEADDQYAIMHFLLSGMVDIIGIGAAHFEMKAKSGHSMEDSYIEIKNVLNLAEIEDVAVYKGATKPMGDILQINDASNAIVEAARKGPIMVATLGALTNIATAIQSAPEVAKNITIILNGGGPYPTGRPEFNVMQDIKASKIVFESEANIWQIPQDVYASLEVSLAMIKDKVYPCGKIGKYLYEELADTNMKEFNPYFLLRSGENWTLGDNATMAVLLMNRYRGNYYTRKAPFIDDKGMYVENPNGKEIRVYTSIDTYLTLEDLFSKLRLAYRK